MEEEASNKTKSITPNKPPKKVKPPKSVWVELDLNDTIDAIYEDKNENTFTKK